MGAHTHAPRAQIRASEMLREHRSTALLLLLLSRKVILNRKQLLEISSNVLMRVVLGVLFLIIVPTTVEIVAQVGQLRVRSSILTLVGVDDLRVPGALERESASSPQDTVVWSEGLWQNLRDVQPEEIGKGMR